MANTFPVIWVYDNKIYDEIENQKKLGYKFDSIGDINNRFNELEIDVPEGSLEEEDLSLELTEKLLLYKTPIESPSNRNEE